jgi:hypothetical protein
MLIMACVLLKPLLMMLLLQQQGRGGSVLRTPALLSVQQLQQ